MPPAPAAPAPAAPAPAAATTASWTTAPNPPCKTSPGSTPSITWPKPCPAVAGRDQRRCQIPPRRPQTKTTVVTQGQVQHRAESRPVAPNDAPMAVKTFLIALSGMAAGMGDYFPRILRLVL